MATVNRKLCFLILFFTLYAEIYSKSSESEANDKITENKSHKISDGAALIFADEFKQILEKYLFGICPQTFRSRWTQMQLQVKAKNSNVTAPACDVDSEHQELAGRLATLSLRAHTASRADCSRLGSVLANTLGELARTAANRAATTSATNEANKKRKLSKSQKAKIQAKQRTALAVKKKAAAMAAAAAAKIATS